MEKFKINKILLPTDFSDLTESAFKSAVAICKRHNAKLTMLHVADNMAFIPGNDMFLPSVKITTDMQKTMEDNIKDLAIRLTLDTGVAIDGRIETGNPPDTICRIAALDRFDMIVMGTHGASGLREFFIGSNAFSVIKHTFCPVLTVPGHWTKYEFKKIVFPVRLIPGSIEKYDYARPIIEKNGSEVLVIGLADSAQRDSVVELKQMVDTFKLQLKDEAVKFSTIIHHSKDFPDKVISEAEDFDADLIIISAALDHNIKTFFVGPFAQQIVNHIKRPVLSIRTEIIRDDLTLSPELVIKNASERYLRPAFS